ncbi:hypothetical protein V2G26_010975 [Clonostachys chloroleuca]
MFAPKSEDAPPSEPTPQWVIFMVMTIFFTAPILAYLLSSIAERWSLCGPFMTDLESGLNDRLYHLDKAAPERSYEEVIDDLQHTPAGEHLAWPDSFYECVVCLESMENGQLLRRLSCGHIFHSHCIIPWYLREHYYCPLCHSRYIPDNGESCWG